MKTIYYYGVYFALRRRSDDFKDFFYNQNPSYLYIKRYVEETIRTMGLAPYETYIVDYEDGDPKPPKRTAMDVFTEILIKEFAQICEHLPHATLKMLLASIRFCTENLAIT